MVSVNKKPKKLKLFSPLANSNQPYAMAATYSYVLRPSKVCLPSSFGFL